MMCSSERKEILRTTNTTLKLSLFHSDDNEENFSYNKGGPLIIYPSMIPLFMIN